MIRPQGSLFLPPDDSVLLGAVVWLEGTLLGTVATVIAVLAVAGVGFMLLQGWLIWRDGARVLLGCFILFGAISIAQGIRDAASGVSGDRTRVAIESKSPPPLNRPAPPADYDPYAGASLAY